MDKKKQIFVSVVFKICFFVSILLLVSLLVISGTFIVSERRNISSNIIKNGETFANFSINKIYDYYVQYYTHPDIEDFENFKVQTQEILKTNVDVEGVSLLAINGKILFDSGEFETGKATEDRAIKDADLLEMIKQENMTSRITFIEKVGEVTEIVVPLSELSGGHVLSMRYHVSNRSLDQRMKEVYLQIIYTVVPLFIFVILLAVPYTIRIINPIRKLTKVADKIRGGDLDVEVEVKSNDEIGVLASTFNHMIAGLRESYFNLKQEKAKLVSSIEALNRAYILLGTEENLLMQNHKVSEFVEKKEGDCSLEEIQSKFGSSFNLLENYHNCLLIKENIDVKELLLGAKYYSVHLSPVFQADVLIGVLVTIGDITEAKVMERSKDEFFSIASHELRTPLTAIRGNTSMIQEFYAENIKDPELKEMVSDIHDSSIRLISIVNDFLDVSRLEQQKIEFKGEPFDIVELGKDALKEYQVTGSRAKLNLEFLDPKKKIPLVFGDKDRVRQIIINLVGNGLKFTETGGVTLVAEENKGQVEVAVTDTGRGIPPAFQGLLFHKFQQAGDSLLTRDTTKGTGLGLYISKLMIEGMGGKIWLAKSEAGKGSTFIFSLPVATKKQGI